MKRHIFFQFRYFTFWILFFVFGRTFFILYHLRSFLEFPWTLIPSTILHGLPLDLSMAGYLCILPFILSCFSFLFSEKLFYKGIFTYTIILVSLLGLLVVTDVELFKVWGSRIDFTVFRYLKSFNEALASTMSSPVVLLLMIWIGTIILFSYLFQLFFKNMHLPAKAGFLSFGTALVFSLMLIIPIRGGFHLSPINESKVYFSKINLANQGALNVSWSFTHSLLEGHDATNPYLFYLPAQAKQITESLYKYDTTSMKVLNNNTPNVLFILWESFTSKALKKYEGKEITPNFHRYLSEGIYFNNLYASGDRSDKGIVAVLSGYPAQTIHSIMNNPAKSRKLPALTADFWKKGYQTSFYYGGEPEFANIKTFLLDHQTDQLITKEDFDEKEWSSQWGAHDGFVFNRLQKDLQRKKEPFFSVLFTLSSHEPFDVPMKPLLPETSRDNLFLNSQHYSDSCLGDFLDKAKKSTWWKNTLIIIVADHGHPLPGGHFAMKVKDDFHIPMVWLGGALDRKNLVVTKMGSQTDIPNTLLGQLKMPVLQYPFSQNLFSNQTTGFAYYTFNNGFGFLQDSSYVLYRNISGRVDDKKGNYKPLLDKGKAYLQYSYQDFLDK